MAKTKKIVQGAGTLRIIAGQWRGRRLRFPAADGLRPTPDRIRETVFNWLMPVIEGANCLDLFAGSGAMGLEALSRGASSVVFVESQAKVAAALKENLQLLGIEPQKASLIKNDALKFLQTPPVKHDLVFLDPPYHTGLLQKAIDAIEPYQQAGNQIYLEYAQDEAPPQLPANWQQLKSKQGGQVIFELYLVTQ